MLYCLTSLKQYRSASFNCENIDHEMAELMDIFSGEMGAIYTALLITEVRLKEL
jgi:hypothetical protein